jgi:AraC family transcriptional regulator, regulatory protein of adaptative response / methylated-DNA-[protein]-cysteine methyltransferase
MTKDAQLFDGEQFAYASIDTVVGHCLVAQSSRGIAAILLGDDCGRLLAELRESLPGAMLVEDDETMTSTLGEIAAMLSGASKGVGPTLDLRGTALELAVWDALCRVPSGETITYGELAKRLRMPATAQEVGAACAANRVAVAVPCHRVIKADGSISGYRWGVARKRKLINIEGAA